jgi:hypothetical protein
MLVDGRVGASPEWIAAAEATVALAEVAVRRAGGESGHPDGSVDDDVPTVG